MKITGPIILLLYPLVLPAAPLPPAVPIVSPEELHAAAAEVPVEKIDLVIPEKTEAAESALSTRFFNQPAERRYSGITNADWGQKWLLFSHALVENAKKRGLDAKSLAACLQALNRGRNLQTALWPVPENDPYPFETSDEDMKAFRKAAKERYEKKLVEREKHPEEWINDHLAIVPVGAYLGRHAAGECWIIVCKWEDVLEGEPMPLGHIMIWAMDTKSTAVVAYVTCD